MTPATFPHTLDTWTAILADRFRVPKRFRPSEWAAENRVLAPKQTAVPGKWDNNRNPAMVEPMDGFALPWVRRCTWMKPPQFGASEAVRNIIGTLVSQDPGPLLMVMQDEDGAKDLINERILPLLRGTAALRGSLTAQTSDLSGYVLELKAMTVRIGWASSPSKLAQHPARYVVLDEVELYRGELGPEGSPFKLAEARVHTYREISKILELSKPTNQFGPIAKALQECPQVFRFWVPCPHCGTFQMFAWPQVRWDCKDEDRRLRAARIETERLAYYQCEECEKKIHEMQRMSMIRAGLWWPGTLEEPKQYGRPDGKIKRIEEGFTAGLWPRLQHIGFIIPGLASPWFSMHYMAAEFLRAAGDRLLMQGWTNNVMGEFFKDAAVQEIKMDLVSEKLEGAPAAMEVPRWCQRLILTVDTQQDHFFFVLRAWGYGMQSQLVHHGRVNTFEELVGLVVGAHYRRAAGPTPGPDEFVQPFLALIDAGGGLVMPGDGTAIGGSSRTDEVYRFTRQYPNRIFPLRGHPGGKPAPHPIYESRHQYTPPALAGSDSRPYEVRVVMIDTIWFKDILASRMKKGAGEPDHWAVNAGASRDYLQQLTSEQRIIDPKTGKHSWQKVSSSAANHFWDCEVYQCAAADLAQVSRLQPVDVREPLVSRQRPAREFRKPEESEGSKWHIGRY